MQSGEYYLDKLMRMAGRFKEMYSAKRYPEAKYIYDSAIRVAAFLEVPEEVKKELFGYYAEEEESFEALFDQKLVSKCYEECTIRLYQGYEHESYRRYGQPPQYYPQPRYPVPGYPKSEDK